MKRRAKILVDGTHLLHRCLFIMKQNFPEENYNFLRHLYLQNILYCQKTFKSKEIIIAFDHWHSWRKRLYPEYKAKRKEQRVKKEKESSNPIDWDKFYSFANRFVKELRNFPFKILQVNGAEGDDVIGALCKKIKKPIIVISSDKDFKQLLRFKHVEVFDPMKKQMIDEEDPERYLIKHILIGDKSDNIPDVKSKKTYSKKFKKFAGKPIKKLTQKQLRKLEREFLHKYFISEMCTRKSGMIGDKTADKIIAGTYKKYKLSDLKNLNSYKRNSYLIDLSKIPDALVGKIYAKYKKQQPTFQEEAIIIYLKEHGLNKLRKDIRVLEKFFGGL